MLISRMGWGFLSPETPQERNFAPSTCRCRRKEGDWVFHKHIQSDYYKAKYRSADFQPKRDRGVHFNMCFFIQARFVSTGQVGANVDLNSARIAARQNVGRPG